MSSLDHENRYAQNLRNRCMLFFENASLILATQKEYPVLKILALDLGKYKRAGL